MPTHRRRAAGKKASVTLHPRLHRKSLELDERAIDPR